MFNNQNPNEKLGPVRNSISRETRLTEFMRGYTHQQETPEQEEENTMIGGSMLYNIGQVNEEEKEIDYEKSTTIVSFFL
jgi:CBS domain containing-hemolysin-like protein